MAAVVGGDKSSQSMRPSQAAVDRRLQDLKLTGSVVSASFLPRCLLENGTERLWRVEIGVCLWGEQMFIADRSSDYGEQSQITELEHVAAKSSKQFG